MDNNDSIDAGVNLIDNIQAKFKPVFDNLNIILLLPTLIGGTWQLLELISISPSFIRFFSLTQLIPDGLLILIIFLVLYISIALSIRLLNRYYKIEISSEVPAPLWLSILALIVVIIGIWFYGPSLIEFYEESIGNITLLLITANIFLFVFFSGIILLIFLKIFRFFAIKYIDSWEAFINRPIKESVVKRFILDMMPYVLLFMIVISIKLIIYDFSNVWLVSRDRLLMSDNFYNEDNVYKVLACEVGFVDEPRIKYFNDKYIFIDASPNAESSRIVVLEFSSFFVEPSCSE